MVTSWRKSNLFPKTSQQNITASVPAAIIPQWIILRVPNWAHHFQSLSHAISIPKNSSKIKTGSPEHSVSLCYQDRVHLPYCGQEYLHHVTPTRSISFIYCLFHTSQMFGLLAILGVLAITQTLHTLTPLCMFVHGVPTA